MKLLDDADKLSVADILEHFHILSIVPFPPRLDAQLLLDSIDSMRCTVNPPGKDP